MQQAPQRGLHLQPKQLPPQYQLDGHATLARQQIAATSAVPAGAGGDVFNAGEAKYLLGYAPVAARINEEVQETDPVAARINAGISRLRGA